MKKNYILVFLLFSFFSFGQAPIGQYKVVFKGWARGDSEQVLELDVSILGIAPRYEWTLTNGFTSDQAKVSLTNAGTYHVKAT